MVNYSTYAGNHDWDYQDFDCIFYAIILFLANVFYYDKCAYMYALCILTIIRPNIKKVFRVTRLYLNLLEKPRKFFRLSGENRI